MNDNEKHVALTIVICATILLLIGILTMLDYHVSVEKEITNRVLGTNGVEFKRTE